MAEIRPFRALHYNQSVINELSAVICPPYDVITPELRQELYHRSQHNFVRVEYARELPHDTSKENKYTRSAATLEQWLREGVLIADETPAIYLHNHYFTYQGKEYKRRGIVVRVRLEDWDKTTVRPHEGTLAEPKSDRLNLLWACQTNTSPIFALYEDEGQRLSLLLTLQERNEPVITSIDANGESHKVWAITEPVVVNRICSSLSNRSLYIADGHHRYESALLYQRERNDYSSSVSGEEAYNFVMMTLVDITDPGLLILPPHRLIRGLSKSSLDGLMQKLESFFKVEELSLDMPDIWRKVDSILTGEMDKTRLVLYGLDDKSLFVLTLRDFASASRMMPYFHCELYKRLDVSVVDHIILENILGVSIGEEDILGYNYDKRDAVNMVSDQEYQLAFLLNPIKAQVIKDIADDGDRMPRKSTYFYPKLPAGLIINRLV